MNYNIGSLSSLGEKDFDKITKNGLKEYLIFVKDKTLSLK